MSKVIKIIMVILGICLLGYLGACAYANFFADNSGAKVKMPDVKEARYEIVIENSGNVYYSNVVTETGSYVKLTGFWELSGDSFKYRGREIILDRKIYGVITIHRRSAQ